jgi:hypothetical protein
VSLGAVEVEGEGERIVARLRQAKQDVRPPRAGGHLPRQWAVPSLQHISIFRRHGEPRNMPGGDFRLRGVDNLLRCSAIRVI